MKIAIVTTFNQKLYDYYAHRFMKTYNWPFDLYVYHEGWHPKQDNVFFRDIHETNPEVKEFIERKTHVIKRYKLEIIWRDALNKKSYESYYIHKE